MPASGMTTISLTLTTIKSRLEVCKHEKLTYNSAPLSYIENVFRGILIPW